MSTHFDLVILPLLKWQQELYKATGTRASAEVYVHSHLFDEITAELHAKVSKGPDPGTPWIIDGREGVVVDGDLFVIRPERARPR